MKNLSQLLSRCLKVFLLVACFDSQDSVCDDFPSLDKHFFIKVEACIKGIANVHPYVPKLNECNGFAETLGRLWCSTGQSNILCSERLCLHTQRGKVKSRQYNSK